MTGQLVDSSSQRALGQLPMNAPRLHEKGREHSVGAVVVTSAKLMPPASRLCTSVPYPAKTMQTRHDYSTFLSTDVQPEIGYTGARFQERPRSRASAPCAMSNMAPRATSASQASVAAPRAWTAHGMVGKTDVSVTRTPPKPAFIPRIGPPTCERLSAEWPEHLVPKKKLGKGSYGSVYLCEDVRSKACVAVKHVRNFKNDLVNGRRILREIKLLASMHHPNLLNLVDLPQFPGLNFQDVLIVMPCMDADLHKVIVSGQHLTEAHVKLLLYQIMRGLEYLHLAGVAHRDLKPSNVLVSRNCDVKIADFGLARGDMEDAGDLTVYVVTRWYRAPEVMLLPSGYSDAVDIWAAGCIQCELVGKRPLFAGRDHVDMIRKVIKVLGTPSQHNMQWLVHGAAEQAVNSAKSGRDPSSSAAALRFLCSLPYEHGTPVRTLYPTASAEFADLAQRLLAFDPAARPTAADALQHPYFEELCLRDREKRARGTLLQAEACIAGRQWKQQ